MVSDASRSWGEAVTYLHRGAFGCLNLDGGLTLWKGHGDGGVSIVARIDWGDERPGCGKEWGTGDEKPRILVCVQQA